MHSKNFVILNRADVKLEFAKEYEAYPEEWKQFFNITNSKEYEQRATIFSTPARMYERGEGEPITYDTPTVGPLVTAIDKEFAAGFMATRRALEDDKTGRLMQAPKWLARAARLTMEYEGAKFLDDAFTGTYYKGIDNKPLIALDHVSVSGDYTSSIPNKPTLAISPSVTAVNSILELFHNMKDENGDPIVMWPDTWVVSDLGYERKLEQILKSEYEPFTAENQVNVLRDQMAKFGRKPKIALLHYTTNKKHWFAIDSRYNDARTVIKRAIELDDEVDFDTETHKWKGSMRMLFWFAFFRGWAGSNPTT